MNPDDMEAVMFKMGDRVRWEEFDGGGVVVPGGWYEWDYPEADDGHEYYGVLLVVPAYFDEDSLVSPLASDGTPWIVHADSLRPGTKNAPVARITHEEAQALHEAIGMAVNALNDALATAAVIVSDTDPNGDWPAMFFLTQHAKAKAAMLGVNPDLLLAVCNRPVRITQVLAHPGQTRYIGSGLAVVADARGAVVTAYLDGVVTPLRPDQSNDPRALASARLQKREVHD